MKLNKRTMKAETFKRLEANMISAYMSAKAVTYTVQSYYCKQDRLPREWHALLKKIRALHESTSLAFRDKISN